jgi:hypothetical protein
LYGKKREKIPPKNIFKKKISKASRGWQHQKEC